MVHDDDLVAHLHGFQLVMRHIDGGRAHAIVQCPEFLGHMFAELGIECAERLVHEECLRPPHDGPAERHALAVATGKPTDGFVEDVLNPEDAGDFRDTCPDLLALHPLAD